MTGTCPKCQQPLTLFYSQKNELIVCQCDTPGCGDVRGLGDCTREAIQAYQEACARSLGPGTKVRQPGC